MRKSKDRENKLRAKKARTQVDYTERSRTDLSRKDDLSLEVNTKILEAVWILVLTERVKLFEAFKAVK